MLRAWFAGLAGLLVYHFFTIISYLFTGQAYLLPGLERHSVGSIGPIVIPRSATFEEGNFAGLFYFVSYALATHLRLRKFQLLSALGVLATLSTSSYAALLAFIGLHAWLASRSYGTRIFIAVAVIAFTLLSYAQLDLGSKFQFDPSASGAVRLNESMTGVKIFQAHPLVGVGLGGYGFHFERFEWNPTLSEWSSDDRHIANNVLVELLSETGLLGLLLFLFFWLQWSLHMWQREEAKALWIFGFACLINFLAYPTFNITYIWVFLGLALGAVAREGARPGK
jgi:hypothetical protein